MTRIEQELLRSNRAEARLSDAIARAEALETRVSELEADQISNKQSWLKGYMTSAGDCRVMYERRAHVHSVWSAMSACVGFALIDELWHRRMVFVCGGRGDSAELSTNSPKSVKIDA